MSGFLDQMAQTSAARVAAARAQVPEQRLRQASLAEPPPLVLSGFDLIMELKLSAPSAGMLAPNDRELEAQVLRYARAGAAAVSVLTEPERFGGTLDHLRRAVAALGPVRVPAMRKDFLVDPYQLSEARAAGAGGALLIVRMLKPRALAAMAACARELGLWILLEAFDRADLRRALACAAGWKGAAGQALIGVNCRDLATLEVRPERLLELAPLLSREFPAVAESGLNSTSDAGRLAEAGYRAALVGTALMTAADPEALGRELLAAGRAARARIGDAA
jgi:indole-3-glycerol phosphate synthase